MNNYLNQFEQDANLISESLNIDEKLAKAQIELNVNLKPPPPILQIDNFGMTPITIMTEGNISVIQGQAKVRKSFAVAMFVAGVLSNHILYRKFISKTPKNVFYFDTEQSKFYVQQAYRRIIEMSGGAGSERLYVFGLRPYTPAERLEMIDHIFKKIKNIGLVVIDGIRDLISNINDPDESTMISSRLMKWTDDTGAHVLTVLHENKGDMKARGHIGTELINKSETILRVEKLKKDPTVSKISCEMVRGLDFDPIYFKIVENVPEVVSGYIEESSNDML
jgi:hypothetical protein